MHVYAPQELTQLHTRERGGSGAPVKTPAATVAQHSLRRIALQRHRRRAHEPSASSRGLSRTVLARQRRRSPVLGARLPRRRRLSTTMTTQERQVTIHIYDFHGVGTRTNAFLSSMSLGLHHSGVEVSGRECFRRADHPRTSRGDAAACDVAILRRRACCRRRRVYPSLRVPASSPLPRNMHAAPRVGAATRPRRRHRDAAARGYSAETRWIRRAAAATYPRGTPRRGRDPSTDDPRGSRGAAATAPTPPRPRRGCSRAPPRMFGRGHAPQVLVQRPGRLLEPGPRVRARRRAAVQIKSVDLRRRPPRFAERVQRRLERAAPRLFARELRADVEELQRLRGRALRCAGTKRRDALFFARGDALFFARGVERCS